MNCPSCNSELRVENYKGTEVDRCRNCGGMWLDYGELDQLEDTVFDKDKLKGSLKFHSFEGKLVCPKCGGRMQRFNYRAYNLELDFCEEGHGTWLDAGEEKRVLELMEQRIKDLNRKGKAEAEWGNFLRKLRSPSFFGKVKGHTLLPCQNSLSHLRKQDRYPQSYLRNVKLQLSYPLWSE